MLRAALRAAFQWISFGPLQYLATALTAFAISGLVKKAIHESPPINSRKGNRTIGSSTSKSQTLQVVGIGMPLPHCTPYFSPNTIVVSRNISKHQHRKREPAEPGSMKLQIADVTMETIYKNITRHSPKPYCCCLRCGCPLPVSWRRRSSGHPAYPPG